MFSYLASQQTASVVIQAMFLGFSICVGITVFALKSTSPFKVSTPIPYAFGFILGGAAIVGGCTDFDMGLLAATGGAVFFSFYLLLDTWLIVNGKANLCYECKYVDQFILAAVGLYIDIMGITIYILQMLGDS